MREGPLPAAALLQEWTRFAAAGWTDPTALPPVGDAPTVELHAIGVGPWCFKLLHDRRDVRAKGFEAIYRATGRTNLALLAGGSRARDVLASQGVPAVLVKGGAFLVRHSPTDVGVRTMGDVDLVVGPAKFGEARRALVREGWREAISERAWSNTSALAVALAPAGSPEGVMPLDLHRHLAQWPLLRTMPARLIADARSSGGWLVASPRHSVLLIAVHRARHAFAIDGRDLLEAALLAGAMNEADWNDVLAEARHLGITAALYGTLQQAAWWFDAEHGALHARAEALRSGLGARAAVVDRFAAPRLVGAKTSRWSGPLGRNFVVFPIAFQAPLASLCAAASYLPLRVADEVLGRLGVAPRRA